MQQLTPQHIQAAHALCVDEGFSMEDMALLHHYFAECTCSRLTWCCGQCNTRARHTHSALPPTSTPPVIQKLGNKVRFRQRVTATAVVFFKRFFLRNKMTDFNPWLIAATACYLASKAEESSLRTTDILGVLKAKFNGEAVVLVAPYQRRPTGQLIPFVCRYPCVVCDCVCVCACGCGCVCVCVCVNCVSCVDGQTSAAWKTSQMHCC